MSDDFSGRLTPRAPRRAYDGIDDRLLYLQPDSQLYDLLLQSGRTGSYIPFTGRARDVIETLFATHLAFPPLPRHSRSACAAASGAPSALLLRPAHAPSVPSSTDHTPRPFDLSLPIPNPKLKPTNKTWWIMFRGEVAPRVLPPKRSGRNATEVVLPPVGCEDRLGPTCQRLATGDACDRQGGDVATQCALSCGKCPALAKQRFALVVFICNGGNDHYGNHPTEQIVRAIRLMRSIVRLRSAIATIAVVHGYDATSIAALRAVGWEVRDVSHVDAASIMKQIPREAVGYHWPRYRANVQHRQDNKCRAIHLLAWNLTEFSRIILSDLDLCMAEDPLPWLRRHATSHFIAFNEMGMPAHPLSSSLRCRLEACLNIASSSLARHPTAKLRGFRGINCHLALLHPSELMARVVLDKARTASYIPYTRGAQDVIETLFPTQVTYGAWPQHVHAMKGVVDYKECEAITRSRLATSQDREAYETLDAKLHVQERQLIAKLQPASAAKSSTSSASGTTMRDTSRKRKAGAKGQKRNKP